MEQWLRRTRFLSVFVLASMTLGSEGRCRADEAAESIVRAVLKANCLSCHNAKAKKGDLDLSVLSMDLSDPAIFDIWLRVHDRVREGEMPPRRKSGPASDQLDTLVSALDQTLRDADSVRQRERGRAMLRRLSRVEFEHTLRDLLALPHFRTQETLPEDGSEHGYDKSAAALDFSYVQVARFLEAADRALRAAVAPSAERPQPQTVHVKVSDPDRLRADFRLMYRDLVQGRAVALVGHELDPTFQRFLPPNGVSRRIKDPAPYFDGALSLTNGPLLIDAFQATTPGYYRIRFSAFAVRNAFGRLEPSTRTETVTFYAQTRPIGSCDIEPDGPAIRQVIVWLEPGDEVSVSPASLPFVRAGTVMANPPSFRRYETPGVAFQWLEMEGPLVDEWPPESHRRLFGDLPLTTIAASSWPRVAVESANPESDARRLLRSFAERAYRRPVEDADLALPLQRVSTKLREGESFRDAMLSGYLAMLGSPDFLLLRENDGALEPFALASRLSYFLWCSPPDDELLTLAKSSELLNEKTLHAQVERMLSSPKLERFVAHFLDHWLDLRSITLTEPDENLYPEFTPWMLESMVAETRLYFAEMLRQNLGARYLVDSDFAMLNQCLAELYNIPDVHGGSLRKVALPRESHRGGLLTQASVLKLTANGTTTSPVTRGDWVLSKILCDPPNPPVAAVAAITPDISGATTVREQLALHRSEASCAACHSRIDPPGFALESFDVMGGWRDRYRQLDKGEAVTAVANAEPVNYKLGMRVDASGEMTDGRKFSGIDEFRSLMLAEEPRIARNVVEQLVRYATGAPVEFADRREIDAMLARLSKDQFGLRAMIHEVIGSSLFQKK